MVRAGRGPQGPADGSGPASGSHDLSDRMPLAFPIGPLSSANGTAGRSCPQGSRRAHALATAPAVGRPRRDVKSAEMGQLDSEASFVPGAGPNRLTPGPQPFAVMGAAVGPELVLNPRISTFLIFELLCVPSAPALRPAAYDLCSQPDACHQESPFTFSAAATGASRTHLPPVDNRTRFAQRKELVPARTGAQPGPDPSRRLCIL